MSCGNPFKHAIEDVKETFSKSCGVPIQGNDWCGLVSNYETDFDEVDYENVSSMFFSSPLSSCQTASIHSRNRPHQNQFHNSKPDRTNRSLA